jgi:eukaryotic-like serine/threonine-protein kinase
MVTVAGDAQAPPQPVKDVRHLKVGDVGDGFRLEAQLPAGGMAGFWRVSRPDIAVPLIMKIPLLRAGEDPITIVGYEMEHMILPRLSGSHVPRFIAAGPFEQPYIVMELIEGRSVRELLAETPLPPERVAAIGAQIAFALHDIHRQHVLHLDLKPSNVFLRPNGEAVLIDYGWRTTNCCPTSWPRKSTGRSEPDLTLPRSRCCAIAPIHAAISLRSA